ncbi:MAG: UMUC-like DNA-repair protein [Rhodobacteraceae bacterium]|nr:UMUC-like DNA-repair protein [Paracoccaceae bacterium]
MTVFRTLYIDMNSFFASVEQQEEPALRGRPLAITAISSESGAVVAASYEAKAFGVGVGTRIYEAKQLCPGIVFRPSRHRLYARVNQKIAAVLDQMAELERVRSIDEFQIALGGSTAELDNALALARRMKLAIYDQVGSELRCSIGIGPNQLLAKIAGKLEKPDGLSWLSPDNMPERLAHLQIDDLPGISRGIRARLNKAMIWDMRSLYALDPRHARLIWHSVEGERFIRALQGGNIPLGETQRSGYGNSKVLAPEYRRPDKAVLVGRWLIEKAAERMRRDEYCAQRFSLHTRFLPEGGWSGAQSVMATQDTRAMLGIYSDLWERLMQKRPRLISSLSVHLGNIIPLSQRSGELFLPLEAATQSRNEKLSAVVDRINRRYKSRMITYGDQQDHPGFFEKG